MKLTTPLVVACAIAPAFSCAVTEVVTAVANDALNADPSLINTLKVNPRHGRKLLEETWGPRVEEPGVWEGFLTWEPVEGRPSPSLQQDEHFKKAASRIFTHQNFTHVEFQPFINLTKSVTAPVTEVIYISINDEADREEYEAAVQHGLDAAGGAPGCLSGAHGSRIDSKSESVMVVGWVSREAHLEYALTETVKESLNRFLKVGSVQRQFHNTLHNFLAGQH